MQDFTFQNPVRVHFGHEKLGLLGKELKQFGQRVLLTYGGGSIKKIGLYDRVVEAVKEAGMELFELGSTAPNGLPRRPAWSTTHGTSSTTRNGRR